MRAGVRVRAKNTRGSEKRIVCISFQVEWLIMIWQSSAFQLCGKTWRSTFQLISASWTSQPARGGNSSRGVVKGARYARWMCMARFIVLSTNIIENVDWLYNRICRYSIELTLCFLEYNGAHRNSLLSNQMETWHVQTKVERHLTPTTSTSEQHLIFISMISSHEAHRFFSLKSRHIKCHITHGHTLVINIVTCSQSLLQPLES